MTTKQKLHQSNLARWATLCREQADSGLTIKDWCKANDISIHTYNYWKHKLKLAVAESALPDIIPVSAIDVESSIIDDLSLESPYESRKSHNSCFTTTTPVCGRPNQSLSLSFNDIHIEIGKDTPDDIIIKLIEVIRHA